MRNIFLTSVLFLASLALKAEPTLNLSESSVDSYSPYSYQANCSYLYDPNCGGSIYNPYSAYPYYNTYYNDYGYGDYGYGYGSYGYNNYGYGRSGRNWHHGDRRGNRSWNNHRGWKSTRR